MKIGQYLAKIWTRVYCLRFFDSRCISARMAITCICHIKNHERDWWKWHHDRIDENNQTTSDHADKTVKRLTATSTLVRHSSSERVVVNLSRNTAPSAPAPLYIREERIDLTCLD